MTKLVICHSVDSRLPHDIEDGADEVLREADRMDPDACRTEVSDVFTRAAQEFGLAPRDKLVASA